MQKKKKAASSYKMRNYFTVLVKIHSFYEHLQTLDLVLGKDMLVQLKWYVYQKVY